jgi:Fe-S cluster assembly ATPase SufC
MKGGSAVTERKKEKDKEIIEDSVDEGRKKAMMDIDRMVNEGMAGGRVHRDQIEEASDMPREEK